MRRGNIVWSRAKAVAFTVIRERLTPAVAALRQRQAIDTADCRIYSSGRFG
jgi:hypothetical protein